jgi:hypothetical protein
MRFLFPALCWAVLIGGFGCAKKPKYNPDAILIYFNAPLDSIQGDVK